MNFIVKIVLVFLKVKVIGRGFLGRCDYDLYLFRKMRKN